ncbi:hypothetical protein DMENIID0001_038850 [Sergentomyia squamirostris]
MATRRCCIRGCLTTRQQRELTLFRVPADPMNVDPCHPCIKSEDQIQCPQGDQPQTHTQSLSENQPYSLPSFYLNIPIILNPGQIALSIPSLVDFSGSLFVEGSSSEAIQSTETSPVQPGNLRNPGKDLEMTPSPANYTHPLLPLLSTGIAVQSNERTPIQSDDELSGPENLPKVVESIIDLTDPLETLQDTKEVQSETDQLTETAPVLIDNLSCLKNIENLEDDTVPEENDAIENTRESIEPEDKDYLQDPERLELDPLAVPHADHQYLPLSYPKDTSTNQEEDPKVVIRTEEPGPLFVGLDMKNQPSCEDQTKEANEFPGIPELDTRCRICLAVAIEGVPLDRDFAIDGLESEKFTIIQELKRLDSNILLGDCRPQQICAKCFEHLKLMVLFRRRYEKTQKMLDDLTGPLEAKAIQATETSQVFEDDLNCPEKIAEYLDNSLVLEDQEIVEYLEEYIESAGKDFLQSSKTWHQPKKYQCQFCPKGFLQKHHLTNHEATHTGIRAYLCTICGTSTKSSDNLKNHMRVHYKSDLICDFCGKSFENLNDLKNHKLTHSDLAFICSICGDSFKQKRRYQEHLQTHSILRKVPGKKKYEYKSYKSYKCRLCNKPYSSYISYKRHVQCHGLSKKCKICEKEFDTVPILLMHVARAHKTTHADVLGELYPSLTKYKCEHCPKTFSGKQGLKFHIEHKHLGIYRYVCPICNKTFQLEINLKSHMATHASITSSNIKQANLPISLNS